MKTFNLALKLLSDRTEGKVLQAGICDKVADRVLLWAHSKAKFLCDGKPANFECWSPCYEIYITPQGWCEMNHFVTVVACTDGKVILDIPMTEYLSMDKPEYVEDIGRKAFWRWRCRNSFTVYAMRSARDIQQVYGCKWSEAKGEAEAIKNNECSLTYGGTVEELYAVLDG